ncbi:GH25311, isoform B [Drosophila grimshawi]|uniref:GH25311, isoform B n=1 Tax=Drosophila grimshawi TaxID=7222 RepID=B4J040_DROGR|nr:GH25311, isoform B [Drosophila grimshawi]
MESAYDSYIRYKNARNVFALKTYVILFVWLILALIQWSIICLVEEARDVFQNHYYISFVTFSLAVLLFGVFIFFESLRYINFLNFLISFIIVELQIISVFAVVVYCHWTEVLSFYGMCFVLLWVFILIGTFLPKEIDLTLDVAVLFILGFIFLIIAVYFVMIRFVLVSDEIYPYIIIEIAISIIILFFVMYHAQTIIGSRFAEMRLNDALLGSLILFHDFLILYWLTFYWQILERPITPDSWLMTSTSTEDTMQTRHPNMRHNKEEDIHPKVEQAMHLHIKDGIMMKNMEAQVDGILGALVEAVTVTRKARLLVKGTMQLNTPEKNHRKMKLLTQELT